MPERYRKRPLVIEAMQYDGRNMVEVVGFVGTGCLVSRRPDRPVIIETLEGPVKAEPGCWIIKGIRGEFYPCEASIFAETYEPVEEG